MKLVSPWPCLCIFANVIGPNQKQSEAPVRGSWKECSAQEVLQNIMKSQFFYSYIHVQSLYCASRWETVVVGGSAFTCKVKKMSLAVARLY